MLVGLRRKAAPIALVTYASFFLAMTPVRVHARDGEGDDPSSPGSPTPSGTPSSNTPAKVEASAAHVRTDQPRSVDEGPNVADSTGSQGAARIVAKDSIAENKNLASSEPAIASGVMPQSLPTGDDKTGVSSQAISVPSGAGKLEGMGESFSAQLSTGIATFNVPIALPAARGGAHPALSLSYSSASGQGIAGMGWSIEVPFIARQTDRGIPKYDDPSPTTPGWHPEQDRFVFNGGQELVPICLVGDGGTCPGKLVHQPLGDSFADEEMPLWASGWQYFRSRVEGSFERFFWSRDHKTWRVQDKSGLTMELGVPLDGSNDTSALEVDPSNNARIFRWNMSREYDARVEAEAPASGEKRPVNVVAYRYATFAGDGEAYLSDIYDTTPNSDPTTTDVRKYAHHTHLSYDVRPDATFSYRRGWKTSTTKRLTAVTVASKTFADITLPRKLIRRYHLGYDEAFHVSLLKSVQLEGRCAGREEDAPGEGQDGIVPELTNCARLPPMTFDYQHVLPYDSKGNPASRDLAGFEGFDERIHTLAGSPDHSVDEELTDLFDINADGLPDVLVTAPALFGGKHGVWFNGAGGKADTFTQSTIGVLGVLGADADVISLKNQNLAVQDLNGDGIIDLLHMPRVQTYSVYTPQNRSGTWWWVGRTVETAAAQSPKIDFGRDTTNVRAMDVNADGLVDLVVSTGTEYQTFFALGRYPSGDGQFGQAKWSGAKSATISNDPATACVPWAGLPIQLSDPDVKLGDMNGDGLVDIIRVHKGDISYWPGRGNGFWGTGAVGDCPSGSFGQGREVAMADSPDYSDVNASALLVDDVNGDGLDDLVQVRFQNVDVWLNVDGVGWTRDHHVISGTPASLPFGNRVRLVDANGSGTRDILWGDGLGYKYIDLAGGQRPWVLTHVANGLGKTTEIEYATSVAQMLSAEAAGNGWQSKAPMPLHIVTRVTERDNLDIVGRPAGKYVTEYTYRDPVYDGRQREFRGFRQVQAKHIGDDNSPTSMNGTVFSLGECKDDDPSDAIDSCAPAESWRDNPREALKGLPVVSETFDELGTFLSTTHHTYRLRRLYVGLDGREVHDAFESAADQFLYDTGPFQPHPSSVSVVDVEVDVGSTGITEDHATFTLRSSAGRAHSRGRRVVDRFGNETDSIDEGCVDGCMDADETITLHSTPNLPSGDTSGWKWRTVETYTIGSKKPSERRNREITQYNPAGDPVTVEGDLSGSLQLDRFRVNAQGVRDSSPGHVAPAPPGASVDGLIVVESEQYDGLGNVVHQTGANGHCRAVDFDTPYRHLPASETLFAGVPDGTGCGAVALKATASYDRGFANVIEVVDLHGERTTIDRDGFGRLTQITKPNPDLIGELSPLPSMKVTYFVTPDGATQPYSIVRVDGHDGATLDDATYRSSFGYQDGFGRTILRLDQSDPSEEGGAAWVANGLTEYDGKGAASRAYRAWFFDGDPLKFPLIEKPPTTYGKQRYDAFGRISETFDLDGTVSLRNVFHALSEDAWDAEDLQPGPHEGTPVSTLADGHGRTIVTTERIHTGGKVEAREIRLTYLPTGETETIKRVHVGGAEPSVLRWARYDSLGRMVLNVEPDTTKNFQPDLTADSTTVNAWRYAYNDTGDLVGTSDARGCGVNYHYDTVGRIVAEDYSPCAPSHAAYSAPDFGSQSGIEVLYRYDAADPDSSSVLADDPSFSIDTSLLKGRLVSVSDRASKTLTRFDARGRITGIARRLVKPGAPAESLGTRYAPHWYTQTAERDAADRAVRESTGADVPELMGGDGKSEVTTAYTPRGTMRKIAGSYGDLITKAVHDADGLIATLGYGDKAETTAAYQYDNRKRLRSVQTYRGPPSIWTMPPPQYQPAPHYGAPTASTFQLLLEDTDYVYDAVSNPVEIRDWRIPSEWPAGSRPVTRKIDYDDLYRATSIAYQYGAGDDDWTDPFAAEDGPGGSTDPRRAHPSPHVDFDKRILAEKVSYDWLGNTTQTTDDAAAFFDRSLGHITSGTATNGPYQLHAATNESSGSTRAGQLTAAYDDAGNLISLAVTRHGPCLPSGASCSQRYVYDWDEVGRLVDARRWDLASAGSADDPEPLAAPSIELSYAYNSGDERIIKRSADATGVPRFTAYVFPSLELRRAQWTGADYERTALTEVVFVLSHGVRLGRVALEDADAPTLGIGVPRQHVFLELFDHLGSAAVVIDQATGELVEDITYQGYGATESDYRPDRWKGFREDYRFTGKEEDVEVGLMYFGERYYAPSLNRWISADPLSIHKMGADLNAYAYVSGAVFKATDPVGLWGNITPGKGNPNAGVDPDGTGPLKGAGRFALNSVVGTLEAARRSDPMTAVPAFVVDAYQYGVGEAASRACVPCNMVRGVMSIPDRWNQGQKDIDNGNGSEGVAKRFEVALDVTALVMGARGGVKMFTRGGVPKAPIETAPALEAPKPAPVPPAELRPVVEPLPEPPAPPEPVAAQAQPEPAPTPEPPPAAEAAKTSGAPRKGAKRGPQPGGPTDQLNKAVADELEDSGMKVTHGGGRGKEEYFPGPDGGRVGSNRADVTAVEPADPAAPKQRVQTVTTYKNGLPTKGEWKAAGAIIKRNRKDGMTLVPKKPKGQ
jgi:RHS repeat-associated protein